MYYKKIFYSIILGFIFSCNIFAQYGPPTYGSSNYGKYSKPGTLSVVKTQTMTTYNTPQHGSTNTNYGSQNTNYGPSMYPNYNPYYSRYYPSRGFNSGPYSSYRHGSYPYLPYRGPAMIDPKDRAVAGLGLLASSLIGKKHA
uniref:Secreted protein n=1 Tax=Strongyloides stercoralis TaxID=6248 RepID=A0A0K0DVM7_STRER